MATQTQYYNLDKPSYEEVADIEIINANFDKIDQQMRNNADGVNFAKGISSDAYDNSKLYAVGDYCIYDNKLYRCITAIESAEAFNIEKWNQTTVCEEIKGLSGGSSGGGTQGQKIIDYTNKVRDIRVNENWENNCVFEYTATEDCYIIGSIAFYSPYDGDTPTTSTMGRIEIEGNVVHYFRISSTNYSITNNVNYYLEKGQTIKFLSGSQNSIKTWLYEFGTK